MHFQSFDVDGNGSLDRLEFEAALRSVGMDEERFSDADLALVFDQLDADDSGSIAYEELLLRV